MEFSIYRIDQPMHITSLAISLRLPACGMRAMNRPKAASSDKKALAGSSSTRDAIRFVANGMLLFIRSTHYIPYGMVVVFSLVYRLNGR